MNDAPPYYDDPDPPVAVTTEPDISSILVAIEKLDGQPGCQHALASIILRAAAFMYPGEWVEAIHQATSKTERKWLIERWTANPATATATEKGTP